MQARGLYGCAKASGTRLQVPECVGSAATHSARFGAGVDSVALDYPDQVSSGQDQFDASVVVVDTLKLGDPCRQPEFCQMHRPVWRGQDTLQQSARPRCANQVVVPAENLRPVPSH